MYPSAQLLALSSLALIGSSSASPLESRATKVNCSDVTTGLDPTCWDTLNMTEWFDNWQKTTPKAAGVRLDTPTADPVEPPSPVVSHCPLPSEFGTCDGDPGLAKRAAGCKDKELWSTCFLRLGLGKIGEDCSQVSSPKCARPQAGEPPHTPQIFYGIWNIYALNTYITTLWQTLHSLVRSNPSAIIAAATTGPGNIPYDFQKGGPFTVSSVLIQLLLKQTNNRILPAAMNAALVDYFAKHKSSNVKYDQSTGVEKLTTEMADLLAEGLEFVMGDLPTFVKVVEGGAFSTGKLPTMGELVKALGA